MNVARKELFQVKICKRWKIKEMEGRLKGPKSIHLVGYFRKVPRKYEEDPKR